MITTKQIFSQPRVTQAALGISIDEFNKLLPVFGQCLKERRVELYPDRKRVPGGWQKRRLTHQRR